MFSKAIMWLWQLPQHLVALILIAFLDLTVTPTGEWISETDIKGWTAVSLGDFRLYFVSRYYASSTVRAHEYGHTLQSHKLGPLYLVVIGLPSLIGNLLHRVIKFDYYKQPWEAWADKLGNVQR